MGSRIGVTQWILGWITASRLWSNITVLCHTILRGKFGKHSQLNRFYSSRLQTNQSKLPLNFRSFIMSPRECHTTAQRQYWIKHGIWAMMKCTLCGVNIIGTIGVTSYQRNFVMCWLLFIRWKAVYSVWPWIESQKCRGLDHLQMNQLLAVHA